MIRVLRQINEKTERYSRLTVSSRFVLACDSGALILDTIVMDHLMRVKPLK